MKARLSLYISLSAALAGWIFAVGGCTTAEVSPQGSLPALPPPYVQVPHPGGYSMSDLRAIFMTPGAPKLEDLKDCDSDFKKLRSLTQAQLELVEGARELVRRDPIKYHWCFYGKILQLESDLKAESYLDEKQKSVLDIYGSLTPMARAFMQEFHDSRYLRWGVKHYREVSEWVFYRKVEMTPQATSDLVEASNPFGMLKDSTGVVPVLEKYNIVAPQAAPPPAAPTASSVPPTAAPVAQAVPVAPTTAAVEAVPPISPSTEVPAPPAPVVESVPPLPPASEAAVITPPVVPADRIPAAGGDSLQALPSNSDLTPPSAPSSPPASDSTAPPQPSAEKELSPSDGTSEAVLQGDSVTPAND